MRLNSRIQKSRHGIYYLRTQQGGLDRKISLRTRDPIAAAIAAHELSAKLLRMKNFTYSGWAFKADGDKIEITTEDNDADRASAQAIAIEIIKARALSAQIQLAQIAENTPKIAETQVVTLATAVAEYELSLLDAVKNASPDKLDAENITLDKSDRQALSVLRDLVELLGADFEMRDLVDDVVKLRWLPHRLKTVQRTTAKRDLSFIRGFVSWAVEEKYVEVELKFSITAKGEHYLPFNKNDLTLIFDHLPKHAKNSWEFWIPIIGLYTGARIAEIASLRTEYIYEKSDLNVMFLAGTKTEASAREIPIAVELH